LSCSKLVVESQLIIQQLKSINSSLAISNDQIQKDNTLLVKRNYILGFSLGISIGLCVGGLLLNFTLKQASKKF
jgi:hypothetical protein